MSQFSKMFGANLKKARSKYFTRAVEFVKASQKSLPWLTYSTYVAYENGTRMPRLDQIAILAQQLQVTTDELFGISKSKNNIENTDLHTIEQFINKHLQADEEPAVISADSDDYRSNFVEIHSKYNNNFLQIHKSEFLDCLEKAHKNFITSMDEGVDLILQRARMDINNNYLVNMRTLFSQAVAPQLGITDVPAFEDALDEFPYPTPFDGDLLYALTFYYFTGCNPAKNQNLTAAILDAAGYFNHIGLDEDERPKIPHDASLTKACAFATDSFYPGTKNKNDREQISLPRLPFLEDFFLQYNDLDPSTFKEKYQGAEALTKMKYLFLQNLAGWNWLSVIETFGPDSNKFLTSLVDVASSHGKKYYQEALKIYQENFAPEVAIPGPNDDVKPYPPITDSKGNNPFSKN